MAQSLIVEGNDAIVLTNILMNRKVNPPIGYDTPSHYRDFVKSAGGYDRVLKTLKTELDRSDVTNIGLIVDADEYQAEKRWQTVRKILSEKYSEEALRRADAMQGYKIVEEDKLPKIGLWVMPDNENEGYLEHFLAKLVPPKDELWQYAVQTVDNLKKQHFNVLGRTKTGKAELHTWLAWQPEPGKPFGLAVQAKYFNVNAPAVQSFIDWFSATFELS